jgi:putative addiction module component (TIGR02574 family)
MSTTAQKICIEVLSLPRQSRAEIAERILASLEDKSDVKADRSWRALIRRRSAEIHSGKARVRPAHEVMQSALQAIS